MTKGKEQEQEKHDLALANNAPPVQAELTKDADIMSLMLDAQKYDMCLNIARHISANKLMPKHLIGDESVCFQVVVQAFQWGMNPFSVAPKTYSVGQKLSFEAQLVNAVINQLAPTQDRLNFEWFGNWDAYLESGCKRELEKGLGVKAWATLKGESKPREIEVKMNSIGIRNSTNWKNDPKQQISYVAVQRWARLYCPDVIMGIYTPDELPNEEVTIKNITPENEKPSGSQSEALLGKLKGKDKKQEEAQAVEAEIVDEQQTISDILEAEIKKTSAPIILDDINAYLKKVKAAGPDVEVVCKKNPKWDEYVRKNAVSFVKKVAEWKVAQDEKAE